MRGRNFGVRGERLGLFFAFSRARAFSSSTVHLRHLDALETFSAHALSLSLSLSLSFSSSLFLFLPSPHLQQEASATKKPLVLVAGPHPNAHANAAVLCGVFSVILLGRDADRSYAPLAALEPLVPFRDPSSGPSTFHLTAKHVIQGIHRAKVVGILDDWSDPKSTFDADEYDHYEAVENGDLNWILPGKLLAFSGPSPSPRVIYGYRAHVPEDYWAYFKAKGVTAVVRLNRALYDGGRFADGGFSMHELYFPDGSCPPEPLLARFLEIAESEKGALAIHCKAGLGRTGVLICSYLIKHFGFSAEEAIGYIRVVRPGSVIGLQQNYLLAHAARLQEEGAAFRAAKVAAAAGAAASAAPSSSSSRRKSIDLSAVAGPAVEAPRAPASPATTTSREESQQQLQQQQQQLPQTRASRLASLLRGVAAAAGSSLRSPSSSLLNSASSSSSLPATPTPSPAGSARNLLGLTEDGKTLSPAGKPSPSSMSPSQSAVTRTLAPNGQPRKVPSALLATPDGLAAYAADEEGTAEGEHAAPGNAAWSTPDAKRIGVSRR